MFLGKEEVLTLLKDGDKVKVTFKGKDKQGIELNKNLFDIAKTDRPDQQTPYDAVMNRLAKNIFLQLADYGLTCIELTEFAQQIGNLTHNLREGVIGKKFGVSNTSFIKLKDLL